MGGGAKIPRPERSPWPTSESFFLDELPQFTRSALEALREPMDGRAKSPYFPRGSDVDLPVLLYPGRGDESLPVRILRHGPMYVQGARRACLPAKAERPAARDRIDSVQVELRHLSVDEQFAETHDDESPRIRASVEAARDRQRKRF